MTIRVYGDPKAQPRGRAFSMKLKSGKSTARVYNPKTAEGWKTLIAVAARFFLPAEPVTGPIQMDCQFVFQRPKVHFIANDRSRELKAKAPTWHISRPDVDNLRKPIMDCLKTLGFYNDDSQICQGMTLKRYTDTGERPGVYITMFDHT